MQLPEFEPHPLIRGGHAQTLTAYFLPGKTYPYRATRRLINLDDGDAIVLHDDCPANWNEGDPAVLLLHGLGGCHQSTYMVRVAGKLNERGVRTFRMDLRGCGAGQGMARLPYHAGRSEDARAAIHAISRWCPDSPLSATGFSLGGNIVLKMLGEAPDQLPEMLERAVVVNPPVDLTQCIGRLGQFGGRVYDKHFVKMLYRQLHHSDGLVGDPPIVQWTRKPQSLWEFDDLYTAPVTGFGDAANFYRKNSSSAVVENIRVPTLIIASADDPVIPSSSFEKLDLPDCVKLHMTSSGGHLGFISRGGADPDRRWMEWRVIDWVTQRAESPQMQLACAV